MLNVLHTASRLVDSLELLLKEHRIGAAQYNVLRILRGAKGAAMCRNDLRDRMLTRMPDMTRLLDRMEEAGLVVRTRDTGDRRVVLTRITAAGSQLLEELDEPVAQLHGWQLGHLTEAQLQKLIELLTIVRDRP